MLITEVEKNSRERIRIALVEYHGHMLCDCRVYFEDDQGEWRPTKKGISLSPDTIDAVIEALQQGSAALEDALSPLPGRKAQPTVEKPTPAAPKPEDRTISERVRAWVSSVNGNQFSVKDCQRALGLTERKQAHLVNVVFSKLCDEGVIERTGEGRGSYRRPA
jgi:hypothetical protein